MAGGLLAKAMRLPGKRVRITTVAGQTWEGTLAGIQYSPTLHLTRDDGERFPPFVLTSVESIEEDGVSTLLTRAAQCR